MINNNSVKPPILVEIAKLSPSCYVEVINAVDARGLYFQYSWLANVANATGYSTVYLVASVCGLRACILPVFRKQLLWFEMLGSPLAGSHTEYLGPLFLVDGLSDLEISSIARCFVEYFRRYSVVYFSLTLDNFNQSPQYLKLAAAFDRLMPSIKASGRSGTIDLRIGIDNVRRNFEGRLRTDIRKATKSGVTVEMYRGRSIGKRIDIFYEIINSAFLRRQLKPRHPQIFFEGISRIEEANSKFFLAVLNDKFIAAALTIDDGSRTIYFAGGATADGLKFSASSLIQMAAITSAIDDGALFYDVGGFGNDRIDKFKKSFASVEYSRTSYLYQSVLLKKLLPVYFSLKRLR